MSGKSFKNLVLFFVFTIGVVSGKTVNFATCMEGPKKVGEGNIIESENEISIEEAKDYIIREFFGCCSEDPHDKYVKNVDYFLSLLGSYGYFSKVLRGSVVCSFRIFFEILGDEGRAAFAELWGNKEFDLTAVDGFFRLFSFSGIFRLSGFKEGLSLFLKSCNNNLALVARFFGVLGKCGDKTLEGFLAFFGCVGISDDATPKHSAFFDADLVFPSLLNLLLNHGGDVDKDIFVGLMRVISGFEHNGHNLMRFVAILTTCAKEDNNTVPAGIFAKLLRHFAYLKKNVAWACENFARILDNRSCKKFKGIISYGVSYNIMEKIRNGSLNVEKFVEDLAAVDPKSFSSEEFAKAQGFKEVFEFEECSLCPTF